MANVAARGIWKCSSKLLYGAYVGYEGHDMVQSMKQNQAVETPHQNWGLAKFHPQGIEEHQDPVGAHDIVAIWPMSILFLLVAILLAIGGEKIIAIIGNRAIRRHEDNWW